MKRNKYGNRRVEIDGVKYASQAEAQRGETLRLLERAGQITFLRHQPRFPLVINGVKVCTYVADAEYRDAKGELVVEDVKGVETDVFKIKRKLMKALHGIDVQLVRA